MFQAKAKAYQNTGEHYVVNTLSGTVLKYNVQRARAAWAATSLPTEQAVVNYVVFVKQNAQREVVIGGPGSMPNNAYELVEYPQMSATVGAYIKDSGGGLVQDFVNFLAGVNPFRGFNPDKITMTVSAKLSDGSRALYIYNNTTKTWDRVKNQTKDSSGNVVPETVNDVSGGVGYTTVYVFNNLEDMVGFIDRMQMLGVPITGPIGNVGRPMVCVTDPETGITHCYAQ